MRLWTLHPKYLDARGLVALWREGLLARAVLKRETKGYRHHPQLARFYAHPAPLSAINAYLRMVLIDAEARGYVFDRRKIGPLQRGIRLRATAGQLAFERHHLLRKLRSRNPRLYRVRLQVAKFEPHPLFRLISGGVEAWERGAVPASTFAAPAYYRSGKRSAGQAARRAS